MVARAGPFSHSNLRADRLHVVVHREWVENAKCKDYETAWFFPDSREGHGRKLFCNDCPVQEHCLAYALAMPGTEGIWGGTSERERRKLLRSRKADAIIISVFGRTDHTNKEIEDGRRNEGPSQQAI